MAVAAFGVPCWPKRLALVALQMVFYWLGHHFARLEGQCSLRRFMNSKVLFRTVRYKPRSEQIKPVMIHVNYHPDKHNVSLPACCLLP